MGFMSQKKEKYRRMFTAVQERLAANESRQSMLEERQDALETLWFDSDTNLHTPASERWRERAYRAERRAKDWRIGYWVMVVFLLLTVMMLILTTPAGGMEADPVPGPAPVVQAIQEPQEEAENERIEAALLERAVVIEDCTVTWYTADTCGKTPDDPAYGITATGQPVVEHLTCAVDPEVVPLYADVFVEYADGTIEQLWATDTGVSGNAIDIYTPDYDYAVQCGRQTLRAYFVEGDTK